MIDLHRIKIRVKILAKSLGDLIVHNHTLSCQSVDVHVPVACPKEYEFSCSSSPASVTHVPKHKKYSYQYDHYTSSYYTRRSRRVHHAPSIRPMRSPLARKLGSYVPMNYQPLMMNSINGDHDVDHIVGSGIDRAAEEFIERFYKELRLQKLYFPL